MSTPPHPPRGPLFLLSLYIWVECRLEPLEVTSTLIKTGWNWSWFDRIFILKTKMTGEKAVLDNTFCFSPEWFWQTLSGDKKRTSNFTWKRSPKLFGQTLSMGCNQTETQSKSRILQVFHLAEQVKPHHETNLFGVLSDLEWLEHLEWIISLGSHQWTHKTPQHLLSRMHSSH